MEKKYIVIPGCCDLNRGDQALGWETVRIAEDAGFVGNYSLLAERGEPIQQSIDEGYEVLVPVLEHPSRKFDNKENIIYDKKTKIKWGLVAVKDLFISLLLLIEFFRRIYIRIGKDKKRIKTLKRYKEASAIFMKGGGLIQSHGGLTATYATYYRLYHIFLAHSLKKPVYIMPNSFGPFEGPFVKIMVKYAFKRCKLITTREKKSQTVVKKELNFDIPLFPDLAFYLENGNVTKEDLCKRLQIENDRKIVAITMRPYRFPDSKNPESDYKHFKYEMRKFIEWLYTEGYMPLVIEHTFAITSHENDGDCIKDVVKRIDKNKYRILSDRKMNCRSLKSVYGCCDYIVGTRFHSLIFSLCNMVPGIAISYDGYKSIGIMRDMNLGEYVIYIGNVNADRLESMFADIVKNEKMIKENIGNYIEKSRVERKKLIELMRK